MRLTLEITGNGAAFDEAPATELAHLVDAVATDILTGRTEAVILDTNGNRCGSWAVLEMAVGPHQLAVEGERAWCSCGRWSMLSPVFPDRVRFEAEHAKHVDWGSRG